MNFSDKLAEFAEKVIEHFTPHNTLEIIGVCFGLFCIVIGLVNYVFTDRKKIFILKGTNDVFSMISNLCYRKVVPVTICVISLCREIVFYHRGMKKWADKKIWLFVFISALALLPAFMTVITGGNLSYMDILPPVGSTFVVCGFYSKNNKVTKSCVAIGYIMYVIYYSWVGNISSVIASVTPIISSLIGLVRELKAKERT